MSGESRYINAAIWGCAALLVAPFAVHFGLTAVRDMLAGRVILASTEMLFGGLCGALLLDSVDRARSYLLAGGPG